MNGIINTSDKPSTAGDISPKLPPHQRTYDTAGRLASYTLAGETTHLTHDAAGRLIALTPTEPSRQQQFGYDAAGRLTSYQNLARTESYTYDANGNRLTRTRDGQLTTYQYTPNSNRLQTQNALAIGHDAAGNRLSDPTRQYAHDSAGRLTQLQQGTTLARYEYNGLGERALKQLGADLRHFVYDDQGHLLGEYDATGQPLAEYAWLGDLPIAYRVYRQVNGLTQTELYTIEADHLGTPRALTDQAQALRWRWQSAPFGDTPPDENPTHHGALTFNLRFPGQYYDQESGLHYNYFRDYDPQTGRYVQSDPIGLSGGVNTYAYVAGNPINYIDSTGEATSGQWKGCGAGCRIRIEDNHRGGGRHLHWECLGKSGECGEFGAISHGSDCSNAPRRIKDCARKHGFEPDPQKTQSTTCEGDCVKTWETIRDGVTGALILVLMCVASWAM